MDVGSVGGLVGGLAVILFGVVSGGAALSSYVDIPSVLIVFFGTLAATAIAYPVANLKDIPKLMSKAMKKDDAQPSKTIAQIIELANKARKDGLLSLEEASREMKDEFLKKGLMLIVDGTDPELVRNLLETELDFIEQRHKVGQSMMGTISSLAPGFGMVGTLIGLVAMLQNMSDPSTIGPSMAVALITTLYGSLMANLVFTPIEKKLSAKSSVEMLERSIILEGLLSIQAGENPRIIEEKLKAFVPPSMRSSSDDKEGK